MPKARCWFAIVLTLVAAGTPVMGQSSPSAGRIKLASGSAFVVRQGQSIPAQVGQLIYAGDGLRTAADGRIGATLNDETRVSLGPGSEIRINQFQYAPAEGRLGFVLGIVRGAVAYVSGRIAKLAPDSIRLETPSAIVGIRGTRMAFSVAP